MGTLPCSLFLISAKSNYFGGMDRRSVPEEIQQFGGGLIGTLFLKRVPAVERPARYVHRLLAPCFQHVVQAADHALGAPQCQQRRFDLAAGIGGVVFQIDRCGGAVVLADGVDRGGVAVAAQVFLEQRLVGGIRGDGKRLVVNRPRKSKTLPIGPDREVDPFVAQHSKRAKAMIPDQVDEPARQSEVL